MGLVTYQTGLLHSDHLPTSTRCSGSMLVVNCFSYEPDVSITAVDLGHSVPVTTTDFRFLLLQRKHRAGLKLHVASQLSSAFGSSWRL